MVTGQDDARRLRHMFGRVPGGGVATAAKIAVGTRLRFTRLASDGDRGEHLHGRGHRAPEGPTASRPRAALIFDCSGRLDALGGHGAALHAEAGTLVAALGAGTQLAGAYTRGEIGHLGGDGPGRPPALAGGSRVRLAGQPLDRRARGTTKRMPERSSSIEQVLLSIRPTRLAYGTSDIWFRYESWPRL